jgi:hypothetical protein
MAKKTEDAKLLRMGYTKLGPQKMWCQVCDSRQVDSNDPATGKFFKAFGLEQTSEMRPTSVLFAICPQCKHTDAVHEIKNVTTLLIR